MGEFFLIFNDQGLHGEIALGGLRVFKRRFHLRMKEILPNKVLDRNYTKIK